MEPGACTRMTLTRVSPLPIAVQPAMSEAEAIAVAMAASMQDAHDPPDFSKSAADDASRYKNPAYGSDDRSLRDNVKFYRNALTSRPDGDTIEGMLTTWRGDYEKLEEHHGYIQWLFPTRDPHSANRHAQPLQHHEIATIKSNPTMQRRAIRALCLFLEFLGLQFVNLSDGAVSKVPEDIMDHVKEGGGRVIVARTHGFSARFLNAETNTHNK